MLDYARQGYESIEFPTYDTDWDSEAYSSVSGQNSNNSIRVTDAFLQAVREDGDWDLINRKDGAVARTIKARDLWEKVGHAAWACADPGIQFHDTVNAWHTCPEDGAIRGSNPCSEYMFLDDTACNLALDEPADLLQGRRIPDRGLRPRHKAVDPDPGNQRDDGPVPVQGNRAIVPGCSSDALGLRV